MKFCIAVYECYLPMISRFVVTDKWKSWTGSGLFCEFEAKFFFNTKITVKNGIFYTIYISSFWRTSKLKEKHLDLQRELGAHQTMQFPHFTFVVHYYLSGPDSHPYPNQRTQSNPHTTRLWSLDQFHSTGTVFNQVITFILAHQSG